MNLERLRQAVLDNKAWTAVTAFLLLMGLGVAGLFLNAVSPELSSQSGYAADSLATSGRLPGPVEGGSGSYVEVQEADIDIESEDAEVAAERIRAKVNKSGGYIESSSKKTTESYVRYDLTAKIPSKKLQDFVSEVRSSFKVNSYSVRNYRVYTQRERDELDIINQTMQDYRKIRKKVRKMEDTSKKLELLMKITEKQLELKEKQSSYERQLSGIQKRGRYATVDIRIEEEKQVDFLPEDLGDRFREEVREMVDNVVETLLDTVTGAVEVFFLAIKYIVYLAVIAVPASFAYRTGKKMYERVR
ncbi:MAG: DUF4349 domain-containing protein [Candidatus Nanohalobium sp.]